MNRKRNRNDKLKHGKLIMSLIRKSLTSVSDTLYREYTININTALTYTTVEANFYP